jgi:hypothetical protein
VSGYGATKTLIMDGPADMHVDIQFSHDSTTGSDGTWFNIKSLTEKPGKQNFDIACKWLRVSIPSGKSGPTNADVAGTAGGTRKAVVPTVAGVGIGASVDVSWLGTYNTIAVAGLTDGEIVLESSHDDVTFEECVVLKPNAPFCSLEFVAGFVRLNRTSGTGTPSAVLCAANDAVTADSAVPRAHITFRPGATGLDAQASNVFTTWQSAYDAAVAATSAGLAGLVELEFDSRFSTHLSGYGDEACLIPAGTWDFDKIIWTGFPQPDTQFANRADSKIDIADGADITNLNSMAGWGTITVTYDGLVTTGPFQVLFMECRCPVFFSNTDANAKPMFRLVPGDSSAFISMAPGVHFVSSGDGNGRADAKAPLIDTTGGSFTILQQGSVSVMEDMARGTGTFRMFKGALADAAGRFRAGVYKMPTLVTEGGDCQVSMRYEPGAKLSRNNEIDSTDSPYTLNTYRDVLYVDTSTGPVEVLLPQIGTPIRVEDEAVYFTDISGMASTNPITLTPFAGDTIEGAANLVIDRDGGTALLAAYRGNWNILSEPAQTTFANAATFSSTVIAGDGTEQDTAHGLGVTPSMVLVTVYDDNGAFATLAEGTHDATNVKVTATNGATYKILAWA